MSFEGEFASYEPLRRILDSDKVKALQERLRVRQRSEETESFDNLIIKKDDLELTDLRPDLILAIDGSPLAAKAENGYPGAEVGYVTVASVLIDLKLVKELEQNEFINPKKFRQTEKASTIETVFPGCNIVLETEKTARASLRRVLFEELQNTSIFSDGETLLDTYEHLFRIKRDRFPESPEKLPNSPIEGVDRKMTYDYGEYVCPHSGEALFSTDALRLHELMNDGGSNGEMFGQIMSTIEKLLLVHLLRAFEIKESKEKGWLATLRRVAFFMDGPLAVFSTSSWLAKAIEVELRRINDLQKQINGQDLLIIGIEKSGTFFNHFMEIDITKDGVTDKFPRQSALLLTDDYIKRHIIFSEGSRHQYGQDTYFGRKFFYKAASGQKIVPVLACFTDNQRDLRTANTNQYVRLADVMELLDQMVSSRYPNSVTPLISAHAEAAIPLSLGKRIFEDIAREIRERTNS